MSTLLRSIVGCQTLSASAEGDSDKYERVLYHLVGAPHTKAIRIVARSIIKESGPDKASPMLRQAALAALYSKLLEAADTLNETLEYYHSNRLTVSHKLCIMWSGLSLENLGRLPFLGITAFLEVEQLKGQVRSRRNLIAEHLGRIAANNNSENSVNECLKALNSKDLLRYDGTAESVMPFLDSVEGLSLEEYAQLHRPSYWQKHWLRIIVYPIGLAVGAALLQRLTWESLRSLVGDSIATAKTFCSRWLREPLEEILKVVVYPRRDKQSYLSIISESNVKSDQLVRVLVSH